MSFKRTQPQSDLSRREIIARRRLIASQEGAGEREARHSWQKNRTIASPSVGSERQAWHALRVKRRRLIGALTGVLASGALIVLVLMQFAGTIRVQTPMPIEHAHTDMYVAVLNDYFTELPFERVRFLTQQEALQAFFSVKAPEVKTVRLAGSSDLATANLQLTFRQPVAQWASGERTYYVDESGVTFERNFFASPSVVVKDESNVQAEAGVEVINRRSLGFLGHVVLGFREHDLTVEEVILPENTLRTMNVRLKDKAPLVQMTVDRDANAQVNEAVKALEYLGATGESPERIIVSVDQKVFYK